MKLIQEAGELSDSVCKGKDGKDDIGIHDGCFNKYNGQIPWKNRSCLRRYLENTWQ